MRHAEASAKAQLDAQRNEIDVLKAVIQSGTTLTVEQAKLAGVSEGGAEGLFADMQSATEQRLGEQFAEMIGQLAQSVNGLHDRVNAMSAPKTIKRDATA